MVGGLNCEISDYHDNGNGKGQLERVRYQTGSGTLVHQQTYGYDNRGRLTGVATDTDAYGNVTAAELNDGRIETFVDYDQSSGRLESLSAYRSTGQGLQDVDYLLDVLGNLKHRHERTGSRNTKERFTTQLGAVEYIRKERAT